ncbi:ParB/Srx family N-terminal domain-containing protein [Methylobacillus sp.]|uniref:ParB/Srx family N-terminal domain-containing protein n=1 Tax=Methylobacillus sp. TaxID=56818 RepID=UPI0012BFDCD0|nr:ParB/Srx family N-terminal domain-containing protein [Methylobacillus sp.]MPS48535.1 chromosome partitioning protein ParB [Methylobacillus sp.]
MSKITNPDWKLVPVEQLIPYEKNVKKHSPEQVKKIAASIESFGWRGSPIQVDENMVIINGHGRRLAAIELGIKQVPVIIEKDMTEAEVRAYRLADNRVAISDYDTDLLEQELIDLEFDLSSFFDPKELEFVMADALTIDESAFSTDLNAVVTEATEATNAKIEASNAKPVAITKVLGFKTVRGEVAPDIARFMAQLEAKYKTGADEAFVMFIRQVLGAA